MIFVSHCFQDFFHFLFLENGDRSFENYPYIVQRTRPKSNNKIAMIERIRATTIAQHEIHISKVLELKPHQKTWKSTVFKEIRGTHTTPHYLRRRLKILNTTLKNSLNENDNPPAVYRLPRPAALVAIIELSAPLELARKVLVAISMS
jgi:hypothetical protein